MNYKNLEFLSSSLIRNERESLVRFLGKMVGKSNAEDVAQLVFLKAVKACGYRGDSNPRAWLFGIAVNAARDWLRSHTRILDLEPLETQSEGEGQAEYFEDASPSQERRLVREQMSQCISKFLARLPVSYQTVLALSDCEEHTDKEIASILGITIGAAKIRLHRARTRLKQELDRGCSFYRDDRNVLCCDKKDAST